MSAPSAGSGSPATVGLTRKIIQRVIYGVVVLVTLLLVLVAALVHHFNYDACANIAGRQKKVPFGFHLEGDDGDRCVVNPPPPPPPPPTVIKTGKEKTLYRFPANGCVILPLPVNWSDYPKGGEISFTFLATGKEVLRDKPGTATGSTLPAGDYRICKIDPDAWGVEIWQ